MKKWFSCLSILVMMVVVWPTMVHANGSSQEEEFFRRVKVSKPQVVYEVKGEARVFEGTYHYRVKDGEKIIAKGWGTASEGGPEWGVFSQTIRLPKSKDAMKANLKLELFEESPKDGSEVNRLVLPLRNGIHQKKNGAFRNIQIHEPKVEYRVSGEARVFEGTYDYAVSDGHNYLAKGWGTASKGAPEWGKFKKTIQIPLKKMPVNGTLMLELYELSMENGQPIHHSYVVMDQTPWK
ncbi:Gmad2 immunoglobulin-like domain-containing protein [Salinithrix halophila]|uniref:Gmad2 immunoglobulin-like domain-containing protein n=1 Tax=Salinithrix halophila TaxID=1485204 RepID=A0ABV8JJ17_9BACL